MEHGSGGEQGWDERVELPDGIGGGVFSAQNSVCRGQVGIKAGGTIGPCSGVASGVGWKGRTY